MVSNEKKIRGKLRENGVKGNWRIYILMLSIFFVAVAIASRLYYLQVISCESYRAIAENQHNFSRELHPERGEIYLRNESGNYPIAVNREYQMAYAVPAEMEQEDKDKAVYAISSVLGIDENILREKFSDDKDQFEILKHKLSDEEISKINELKIVGVYLRGEVFRYYPADVLASQVIGFVGSDGESFRGRYGIESYWEEELSGEKGVLTQERDAGGRWISISDRNLQPAKNGPDLLLTIDYAVQFEAEKILSKAVEEHGADEGSVVVMDPKTGRILAVAGAPSFSPNEYSQVDDMSKFMNSSVSGAYESGSVFKPITMAIAIDDGKVTPESTYVDTGQVLEAGYVIKNSDEKAYGKQTMTQVLEESLNTGVIHIERLVGNKTFAEYVRRFGFGEKSGIELPGESAGNINNLKALNRDIQFFTASFGQGITTTPLQLANAYSTIANGGKLMRPQIVYKIIHSSGKEEEIEPQEIRRVIREDTAEQVSQMLRSVVVNGHGKRADVPGYLVGGKTGTAQVASSTVKGYEEGINVGSFVGFAPTNDPMFVIAVKIYNPKNVVWAESSAAPVFGEIMKFLLEHYNVEPTEEIK